MQGGVAVHGPDGAPKNDQSCAISTFLDLREQGLIEQTRREVSGYPYYATNHKSSEYKITEKGRQALSLKPRGLG